MIKINNLFKKINSVPTARYLFHSLNLDIEEGQTMTILGPNGCGKSTLLNIIAGIDNNYVGQILIGGSIEKKPLNVAYMQQKNLLLPWLTVEDNICLGLQIQNKLNNGVKHKIEKYLQELGISDMRYCYPSKLSGGERQKVALIRTLVLNAPVLLLDEPFSAIDWVTRGQLQRLILSHALENGTTVLLVTHDIEEAILMSDRILMLNRKINGIHIDLSIKLAFDERDPEAMRTAVFTNYYNEIRKISQYEKTSEHLN